jgi:hypothetical protein
MIVRGQWCPAVVCDIPDRKKIAIEDILGAIGGVDIAFDSNGRPTLAPRSKAQIKLRRSPCHAATARR